MKFVNLVFLEAMYMLIELYLHFYLFIYLYIYLFFIYKIDNIYWHIWKLYVVNAEIVVFHSFFMFW